MPRQTRSRPKRPMARDQVSSRTQGRRPSRPSAPVAAKTVAPVATPAAAPKPKVSPAQFVAEVRQEARKITWPSWKETWITSVMVFIMVTVTAVFFLVADGALSFLLQQILKLAA